MNLREAIKDAKRIFGEKGFADDNDDGFWKNICVLGSCADGRVFHITGTGQSFEDALLNVNELFDGQANYCTYCEAKIERADVTEMLGFAA